MEFVEWEGCYTQYVWHLPFFVLYIYNRKIYDKYMGNSET